MGWTDVESDGRERGYGSQSPQSRWGRRRPGCSGLVVDESGVESVSGLAPTVVMGRERTGVL